MKSKNFDLGQTQNKRKDEEGNLQRAIIQHLKLLSAKKVIWFAVPNGVPASKRTGARFKALGVVAGVPDLAFVLPDGHAAFMELKSLAGRLSPDQKAFADKCAALGIEHAVTSNLDQALSILRSWGVLPPDANKEG